MLPTLNKYLFRTLLSDQSVVIFAKHAAICVCCVWVEESAGLEKKLRVQFLF